MFVVEDDANNEKQTPCVSRGLSKSPWQADSGLHSSVSSCNPVSSVSGIAAD